MVIFAVIYGGMLNARGFSFTVHTNYFTCIHSPTLFRIYIYVSTLDQLYLNQIMSILILHMRKNEKQSEKCIPIMYTYPSQKILHSLSIVFNISI